MFKFKSCGKGMAGFGALVRPTIFAGLFLSLVAAAPAARSADDSAAQAAGQKVYARICQRCHNGPTEGGEGPALVPLSHTPDEVRDIVRFGTGEMKALATSDLSDDEVNAVIAYLAAGGKAK